ncbi:MAG: TlpA family protein disulfide reductase [Rubrivivax sp.]|nr:TlpA family protein disulfide reductase [Rubrivivax sp.]
MDGKAVKRRALCARALGAWAGSGLVLGALRTCAAPPGGAAATFASAAASFAAAAAGAVAVGQPAPAFTLAGLEGSVALEALRGKVVLLDFWASWCAPCRLSFPWMSAMQARHGAAGLRVVAVNVDRQRAAADAFLRAMQPQMGAPLTIAFDPAGETPERYGAKAMPTSVLIGADGRVLLHHAGFRDDDKPVLEAAVVAALAAAKAPAR